MLPAQLWLASKFEMPKATLAPRSVEDAHEIGADRLAVETRGHVGHRILEPQTIGEAPREHFVVARRQQESRPSELRCSSDQRDQISVAPGHAVGEESDLGGI